MILTRRGLLVGASPEQAAQMKAAVPGWEWLNAPEDWPSGPGAEADGASMGVVIVLPETGKENLALDRCRAMRERREMDGIPLLVAISRYQMSLGNAVRRLPHAHFVLTPIAEEDLRGRLAELNEGAPPLTGAAGTS